MAAKEQELLTQLETRVRQLILRDKALQERCGMLEQEVALRDEKIKELGLKNQETAAMYANLKVAKILELSDDDTRNARQRLNRLVKDVDKCIALLKS